MSQRTAVAAVRRVEQARSRENFPVALRVLPGRYRRHLLAVYAYARQVDDLGDEPLPDPTDRLAALDHIEAELRSLYADREVTHPVVRALAPTVAECRLPLGALVRLIEANRVDQRVTRYATFDELVGYCTLSANPVGELVLHVFGQVGPDRVALSDRVCTALQLVEHLQDVAEDHQRGRIYLPAEDMDRFDVTEADLARPTASRRLRDLIEFEAERARAWLDAGAPLVAALHGWARLAVSGYLAGGRATLDALAAAGYDPLPTTVRPRGRRVLHRWLAATVRSAG
ncbi:squalene synthase HpnC [Micromonospora narathiwatensis]|uniref:Squalene synthase HpnC n=1 Tax=Micromonospora narathiwatensis TaxID=299146 RepID=A0A1A8ZH58_9ACTN|nr:squalene synthase HpnC [Micromonospora narathiwatensis]SBT43156.1 squalene synthase HpnC [Micromonospora narathiwatensis]